MLLTTAIRNSSYAIFDYLLTQDVDINELTQNHVTPINFAVHMQKRYFINRLLLAGADSTIPDILLYILKFLFIF